MSTADKHATLAAYLIKALDILNMLLHNKLQFVRNTAACSPCSTGPRDKRHSGLKRMIWGKAQEIWETQLRNRRDCGHIYILEVDLICRLEHD